MAICIMSLTLAVRTEERKKRKKKKKSNEKNTDGEERRRCVCVCHGAAGRQKSRMAWLYHAERLPSASLRVTVCWTIPTS